jgi:hypothetical protein
MHIYTTVSSMPPRKSPGKAKTPAKRKTMTAVADKAAATAARKPATKKQKKADKGEKEEKKEEKGDEDADDDDDEKLPVDKSYGQLHRTGFIMAGGTGVPLLMRVKHPHAQLAREDGIVGTILCSLPVCVRVCVCTGGKHGVSKPISVYIDPTFCL